jgi:hypothetical protein
MNYFVRCPAAPWLSQTVPAADAFKLCHQLAQKYGYSTVHRKNGKIIFEQVLLSHRD